MFNPVKSKTKGIIFSAKPRDRSNVLNLKLNGDELPWVNEVKHLGNTLENNNSMQRDMSKKKGQFIGKVNSMLQEFHYVHPKVFMKLINVYILLAFLVVTYGIYSLLTVNASTRHGMWQ